MHPKLQLFTLLVAFTFFATACQTKTSKHHDSFLVFGTIVNVTLVDIDNELAQESFRSIREDLKIMHRAWHVWEPGPLMRTNKLLETKIQFSIAPSVIDLFQTAKTLSLQSQNLFNPAIGKLIALWGFHSHNHPEIAPSKEAITKLLKLNPSMLDITLNGFRAHSKNAAVKLDFGGVAKGFAVERLLKGLKEKGINNALIDTGGDLKVIGQHGERAWKIAIRDPRAKGKLIATIELKDNEAAFTSGDYERYFKSKKIMINIYTISSTHVAVTQLKALNLLLYYTIMQPLRMLLRPHSLLPVQSYGVKPQKQ